MATSIPDRSTSLAVSPGAPRIKHARLLVVTAFVLPLVFAWITDHVWEDFYITFRSSRNLIDGYGLVFQPGELVHTFTSPLGVLVPALCALVSSADSLAIWIFRLCNATLLAATMYLWTGIAARHLPAVIGRVALFGLLLLDAKIVAFAMNGMETAFLLFFVTLAARELLTPHPRRLALAVAFGGLMWTRPDGFVFFGALLAGALVFIAPKISWRPALPWLREIVFGLALGSFLYLPWVLWATYYYGSPIPNTVLAKTEWVSAIDTVWRLLSYPLRLPFADTRSSDLIFGPIYPMLGGWPEGIRYFSNLLVTAAALYVIVPGARREGRALSCAFFIGCAYLEVAPPAPWYYQAWQLLAIAAFAFLVTDTLRFAAWIRERWPVAGAMYGSVTRMLVLGVLCVQAGIIAGSTLELRVHQRIVQDGVRKEVGLWLRDHARPQDRVFLEPLGYIGYFSKLKMLDYPGLSAPEMAAELRKSKSGGFGRAIPAFWPEWLVLRPFEIRTISADILARYDLAETFDRRAEVNQYAIPGRGYVLYDAAFMLFRLKEESPEPPRLP